MPKRIDIKSILIIGSGPIVIGQSCEFDYAGSQACKALTEEGFKVILLNSNPATIMTDRKMADCTYLEPINLAFVTNIIAKTHPDTILSTMGGQTALNLSMELHEKGILKNHNVELIGATYDAIKKSEDRTVFRSLVHSLGYKMPRSKEAKSIEEALPILDEFGLPCIVRNSFSLGGNRSGIAYHKEAFIHLCQNIFKKDGDQKITIDEAIIGFKEFELEVVRDSADNCIIVCSIENFNPMGVHTGDSITVAPAQTLTDKEYHLMRKMAFNVIRKIGINTGGANIQFAIDPQGGEIFIIEVNPRVSRSSALASKATGFPIAKVAAKLAVGYVLNELKNEIADGKIPSSFEPSLDYVVTKIPKFNFNKFPNTTQKLDTQMRSVGEVMGIGSNFQASIQKSIQSLEEKHASINKDPFAAEEVIKNALKYPTPDLIFKVISCFKKGHSISEINKLTKIDPWFLHQLASLVASASLIENKKLADIDIALMKALKKLGFSDKSIAVDTGVTEKDVIAYRYKMDISPVYKRVDSCSAEFATSTAYLYSSYDDECEAFPSNSEKIVMLGSGPNRIGQGIEFDYSCTCAALALKKEGFEVIMVNSNPETVSTDFNIADKLYFAPITLEHVYDIVKKEQPIGIICQFGGQTPLQLIGDLEKLNVNILGPDLNAIKITEDRELFQKFIFHQKIPHFSSLKVKHVNSLIQENIAYPVIIRPSYVIGGKSMEIIYNYEALTSFIKKNNPTKLFLERFLETAIELDVDLIYDGETIFICGIMEQVEYTGVHSGDSIAVFPTYSISEYQVQNIIACAKQLVKKLDTIGIINIQLAIKDGKIYIIEVNLRASRTIPFLSKATGIDFPGIAALSLIGKTLKEQKVDTTYNPQRWEKYFVKMPVFPHGKFSPNDLVLGPEMKSTGEVMCFSKHPGDALLKSFHAAGFNINPASIIFFYKISKKDFIKTIKAIIKLQNFKKLYILKYDKHLLKIAKTIFAAFFGEIIIPVPNFKGADIVVNITTATDHSNLYESAPTHFLEKTRVYEVRHIRVLSLIANMQFNGNVDFMPLQEVQ